VSNSEFDCRYLADLVSQVQVHDSWKKLSRTWEEFCIDQCGRPAEFIDAILAGARVLGFDKPLPSDKALRAAQLLAQGKSQTEAGRELGISQQRVSQLTSGTSKSGWGNRVSLHPDPARAAQTILKARGAEYAAALAGRLSELAIGAGQRVTMQSQESQLSQP
jgi:hypothetical protein